MYIIYTLPVWFVFSYSQLCNRPAGLMCCLSYYWNETLGNCTACKDGYYGENCSVPCPEMFYGKDCRSKCVCNKEQCHHVSGCMNSSSTGTTTVNTRHATEKSVNIGENHWKETRERGKFSAIYATVICLASISGVLLVLYIGVTFRIKNQPEHLPPNASTV